MITKKTPKDKILELAKECRKCGSCCRFTGGFILEKEISGIAQFLGLSKKEFMKKYLDEVEMFNTKVFKMKREISEKPFSPCVFYDEAEKCMIHDSKPLHCRVGNCNENGEELIQWYFLNNLVNENDPESVRQWATFIKQNNPIPGGNLSELVPDKEKLKKIMNHEVLK